MLSKTWDSSGRKIQRNLWDTFRKKLIYLLKFFRLIFIQIISATFLCYPFVMWENIICVKQDTPSAKRDVYWKKNQEMLFSIYTYLNSVKSFSSISFNFPDVRGDFNTTTNLLCRFLLWHKKINKPKLRGSSKVTFLISHTYEFKGDFDGKMFLDIL
jgi:hypothetical protein